MGGIGPVAGQEGYGFLGGVTTGVSGTVKDVAGFKGGGGVIFASRPAGTSVRFATSSPFIGRRHEM